MMPKSKSNDNFDKVFKFSDLKISNLISHSIFRVKSILSFIGIKF